MIKSPLALFINENLFSNRIGVKFKIFHVQLMMAGVASDPGHNAQQCVEEGLRLGPDPARTLLLLTGELNVRDKALRTGIATLTHVQVESTTQLFKTYIVIR
jgi:hypothetical protein